MMLLSAPKMDGFPPVYNDLYVASRQLLDVMRATDMRKLKNEPPANKIARRFFRLKPKTEHYTGFAAMLSRLTGASRKNLGLIGPQSGIWMMLYLQHFSVTINRMGDSFFGVLTGPPDTGKSRACEVRSCSLLSPPSSARPHARMHARMHARVREDTLPPNPCLTQPPPPRSSRTVCRRC